VNEARASLSLKTIAPPANIDDAALVSDWFSEIMRRTLGDARTNLLLIFDEIENISPKTAASEHWKSGRDSLLFWQTLRSFFQSDGKWKITFCFVGTNPHLFEQPKIGDVDNPVYLFAPKTFIPPFSISDAAEMCNRLGYFMGLNFDYDIISLMHEKFGGHPFFIRQACSRIHQIISTIRPVDVSRRLVDEVTSDGLAAIRGYIEEILNSLRQFYPEEYDMLVYLAGADVKSFLEIARSYPSTVEHLIGYGLVRQRGEDFEFSMNVLKDIMIGHAALSLGNDEINARREEISRRRNALEEAVRVRLFFWAQGLSATAWRDACLKCIPKRMEGKQEPPLYREIFSKNKSPIFLLETMKFVEYANFFGDIPGIQSEINRAFDVINRLRPDAHAKDISKDEYNSWLLAIQFLEDKFLPS
jgi:hypothetical protein